MNRSIHIVAALVGLGVAGCGADRVVGARLEAPEAREARVMLTPALDVAGLIDPAMADRILIDEIVVNLADVRLLGSDPQIPTGGWPLLSAERPLSSLQRDGRFPFPEAFLRDELAVYVRLEPSLALEGSSVIVRARLFEDAVHVRGQHLTSDEAPNPDGEPDREGAPNPDGEPDRQGAPNPDGEPDREGAPNPDGEPDREGAPNPDGEPDYCGRRGRCLTAATQQGLGENVERANVSLPFELRANDTADLLVGFQRDSRLNVLLGVPARRWFTDEVVAELERALHDVQVAHAASGGVERRRAVVVDGSRRASGLGDGKSPGERMRTNKDDYRLVDDRNGDPSDLRQ